jgi:hypothetical protein
MAVPPESRSEGGNLLQLPSQSQSGDAKAIMQASAIETTLIREQYYKLQLPGSRIVVINGESFVE